MSYPPKVPKRLQFEPEVLASVWASDDRRPGYLLKSWPWVSAQQGVGGSAVRTRRRRRRRRRGVVQLRVGTDKTGTEYTERVVRWVGSHINGLSLYTACGGGRGGREADETLLRLRGKSCVGQVLASSSLCACPESFFFFFFKFKWFSLQNRIRLFFIGMAAKRNEFELWSLKYS